jgi:hypothetical protein
MMCVLQCKSYLFLIFFLCYAVSFSLQREEATVDEIRELQRQLRTEKKRADVSCASNCKSHSRLTWQLQRLGCGRDTASSNSSFVCAPDSGYQKQQQQQQQAHVLCRG